MKTVQRYGVLLLFFAVLSCLIFRAGWGADSVFAASDANIGLMSRVKNALPDAFSGSFRSAPLIGSSVHYSVSARNLLLWLLPAEVFSDLIYPFWLVLSSLVLVAYLRLWKTSWFSCVFGAMAAFWTGSITLASSGHVNKPAVAFFFVSGLYLVEKTVRAASVRRRIGYALLCGGVIGLMLVEQQDVGLYAACFLFPYFLLRLVQAFGRKGFSWLQVLVPVAVVSLLICGAPALKAYSSNVTAVDQGAPRSAGEKWEFITQWSFPPAEWPDLVAPGYTGWSTGNPDGPYWGVMGQSAEWETARQGMQNFRLDSLYIGIIPLLLGCFGWVVAARRLKGRSEEAIVMFFWGVAALAALWLSFGKFSPLYRLFYHLPLVNNVRAPVKFMHNFQMMAGILSAFGLHQLLAADDNVGKRPLVKWVAGIAGIVGGLMLLAAMSPSLTARFSMWGNYTEVIVSHIRRAWGHGAVMALLCGSGLYLMSRKRTVKFSTGVALVFILAVGIDSAYLTSKYFRADDLGAMKKRNPVIEFLVAEQGNERVFLLSQEGVYNRWLAVDFPYYGIQAFNIWQMPRMSASNREFLSAVGNNWVRLVELSSVKYVLAPAGVWSQIERSPQLAADFEPVLFYRFIASGKSFSVQAVSRAGSSSDQVLLRFKRCIPRLALFSSWEVVDPDQVFSRLASADYHPDTALIIDSAAAGALGSGSGTERFQTLDRVTTTSQGIEGRVVSDRGGIVLCTQYFDPDWTVWVNGQRAELLRCNGLAMGVEIPPGVVTVRFACPRSPLGLVTQASGIFLALCGILLLPGYRQ